MALEVGRYEMLFSYWLAKIKVLKKSAKKAALPALSIFARALCRSLHKQNICSSRIFTKFGWYGKEMGKNNTCATSQAMQAY
jgi:hypothetical protein